MGTRGPRSSPPSVKIANGTFRADRHGDPALAPKANPIDSCPPPPDSLEEHGREVWIETIPKMIDAGYFTQLDMRGFERYCQAHDRLAECRATIAAEGEDFTTDKGFVGQHPAVNRMFRWLDIIRRYEDAFWLNPTARSGKQISGKAKSTIPKRNRA